MTTGPSSGHSESWYWLQSSHPATDMRVSEGTECWEPPPPQCSPQIRKQCKHRMGPPRERPPSAAHFEVCSHSTVYTENKISPRRENK